MLSIEAIHQFSPLPALEWPLGRAATIIVLGVAAVVLLMFVSAARWRYIWSMNRRPRQWLRTKLGRGMGVAELARRLGVSADELAAHQPDYVETYIPKRSGGTRRLDVPDAETKYLQRRILHRLLSRLRAHPAACGFERGRSIVHNALPHVGQAVVVRMDIVDFFPTTGADRVERYFRRVGWNKKAAALLTRLTTYNGGLPQGAPTSPRLSNLVNYYLDVQLTTIAGRRKATYTRYADDITISFPKDYPKRVRGIVQSVSRLLKAHGYRIHKRKKLHIRRRHQRQVVTGLVVNEKVQLPREVRRRLRAARHYLQTGRLATLSKEQLAGWDALQAMIEKQTRPAHWH